VNSDFYCYPKINHMTTEVSNPVFDQRRKLPLLPPCGVMDRYSTGGTLIGPSTLLWMVSLSNHFVPASRGGVYIESKILIFTSDRLFAVLSLQPSHNEVPAGHILEVINKDRIDNCTSRRSNCRYSLRCGFL